MLMSRYDDPTNPLPHIKEFIKTYNIDCSDLLETDLTKYKNFNEFFYRALAAGARPIAEPESSVVISSVADCRLTVFQTIAEAQQFWIKVS